MVNRRTYGQFCGFARAMEVVGERWGMMIIRDLLVAPKRFGELQRGLPKIPTNILTARLKELEAAGVVERRAAVQPGGGVLYRLTSKGRELEEPVLALGRWGAKNLLDEPRPGEIVTNDSMVMALRTTFQPQAAKGLHASYELRMGPIVIHAKIDDGTIDAGAGSLPEPDLIVEAGPALKAVMAREIAPRDALANKSVRITGDPALFDRFAEIFTI